jgi:hypothetical protein
MTSIIKAILAAILRRPSTTDAITSALTKTVTKLEAHVVKSEVKYSQIENQITALAETGERIAEDAEKARVIAKNLGALFRG